MFPFFNNYPGTDLHEIDLAYLLKLAADLEANNKILMAWKSTHEAEYQDLLDKVNGLIENLIDVIVPWDSSVAYHIFSIVEYQGTNYIAVQDVPVGAMITDTTYWQPANTVVEQLNAIGLTVSDLQDEVESIPETVYPRRAYFRPEDYGAIVNDPLVDNSTYIRQAIIDANANAGIVLLSEGKYYVNNGVTVPERVMGVDIIGTGGKTPYDGNYGSIIVNQGSGFALHFSSGMWGCTLKDFSIICTNAVGSGIKFSRDDDPSNTWRTTRTKVDNVDIYFGHTGIDIKNAAYLWIENCNIHYTNDVVSTERYAVIIGDSTVTANMNEYIQFVHCQMVCGIVSAAPVVIPSKSVGLSVYGTTHLTLIDDDITDCDVGVLINPAADVMFIDAESMDIARARYGIYVELNNKTLNNTVFNNLVYTAPSDVDATDRVLKVNKVSGSAAQIARLKIYNLSVRTGFNDMDYAIEANNNAIGQGMSDITYDGNAVLKMNLGNNYRMDPDFSTLSTIANSNADMNDFKITGCVKHGFGSGATNSPGFACMLLVYATPNYVTQIAIPLVSSGTLAFRVYTISSDTWSAWQKMEKTP